jgi:hypothetical protein
MTTTGPAAREDCVARARAKVPDAARTRSAAAAPRSADTGARPAVSVIANTSVRGSAGRCGWTLGRVQPAMELVVELDVDVHLV